MLAALLAAAPALGAEPPPPSTLEHTGIDAFSLYDIGSVRGLDASRVVGNFRWNGLPILNQVRYAREGTERYDVQAGLRALDTGFVFPGGVVDLVGKDAGQRTRHVSAGASAAPSAYLAADVGTGVVRLNAALDAGDSELPGVSYSSSLAALGVALTLSPRTTLRADFEWQRSRERGEQASLFLDGRPVPAPPPADTLLGQDWDGTLVEDRIYSIRVEHRLGGGWSAHAGLARLDERVEDADFFGTLLADERYRLGYARAPGQRYVSDSAHAELRGAARTGGVRHRLALGATAMHYSARARDAASVVLGESPLRAPRRFEPVSVENTNPLVEAQSARDTGVQLSDTATLTEHLTLLAALRAGTYRQSGANVVQPADEGYRLKSAGAAYALGTRNALYASYGEALEQGTTVPLGAPNAERVLPSYVTRQVEAGARFAPRARLELEVAVFRARKGYDYPSASGEFVQDGTLVQDGAEVKAVGEPAAGTRLYAALLLLRARVHGAEDPAVDGQPALDVPPQRLKLVLERSVGAVPGLAVHLDVDAYSSRPADAFGRARLPGYALLGVGADFALGARATVRFALSNLADRAYWAGAPGGYLVLGAPRSVYLRLEVGLE